MRIISVSANTDGTDYKLLNDDGTYFDVLLAEDNSMNIQNNSSDVDEEFAFLTVLSATLAEKGVFLTKTSSDQGVEKFWVDYPSGRALEITREEYKEPDYRQYWTWSVHYSEHEFDDGYGRKNSGIIETRVSNDIGSPDGVECFMWGSRLASSDYDYFL